MNRPLPNLERRSTPQQMQAPVRRGPSFRFNGYDHIVTTAECADILVVCDPQSVEAHRLGYPMHPDGMSLFLNEAEKHGIAPAEVTFINLCPPVPVQDLKSAARKWAHVERFAEGVREYVRQNNPAIVVTLGELASRVMFDRAVKITKARGVVVQPHAGGPHILPMLSPGFVARVPEHMSTFAADIGALGKLKEAGYDPSEMVHIETNYEWCFDLTEVLKNPPKALGVDTETTGLRWHQDGTDVLTIQFATAPGRAFVCPVHREYIRRWFPDMTERQRVKLIDQCRQLLENPDIPKLLHNAKFDFQMLRKMRINMKNVAHDTILMAFGVDENMMSKTLDDCVRVWVPDMAGYADAFNASVDKNRMIDVPPYDVLDENGHVVQFGMLNYAAGDPDAVYRLARVLWKELHADAAQFNIYRRVQMPGIMAFAKRVENYGMVIDTDELERLGNEVRAWLEEEYRGLIRLIPGAVKRKHLAKGLQFSRDEFVRDVLFSPQGFNLKPRVFTSSTQDLSDDQKVPSVSTKDHFPYFVNTKGTAGEFINRLIEFQKTRKMETTYLGERHVGNGFWQYLSPDNHIFPSFALHKTNTGRTASSDPNGQNYPKRGKWAKPFLKIFKPNPGFRFVAADLSQIELRIAAWEAHDRRMLEIYRQGGDIHMMTAAATMRLTVDQFRALDPKTRKFKRFCAKAVNFGFVYGMGANGFRTYAKTQYGVDYTQDEAEETRHLFFDTYRDLPAWHQRRRDEVRRNGFVRSLHGAVRHLQSIQSNDRAVAAMAERQAINAPVQRFGSDLGLMALTRLACQADPDIMRPVGFVHDQVICEARIGHELETVEALVWAMENPPLQEWFGIEAPLPIKAEPDIGDNLGETIELNELPLNDEGNLALPEWFENIGLPLTGDGKRVDFNPHKPDWWQDDEEAALRVFMTLSN